MKKTLFILLALMPLMSFAQATGTPGCGVPTTLTGIITYFACFINDYLIPFVFAIAILYFIYGVVKYVIMADSDKAREEGRKFMIYGVVALFVMISVWGLVNILNKTFGTSNIIPQLPTTYK